jgi:malic enzyme
MYFYRYIFPGVGLGAIAAGALTLTDDDFMVAASCLASLVSEDRLAQGCAYPSVSDIRQVSLKIAVAVAESIIKNKRASPEVLSENYTSAGILKKCADMIYTPVYK